MDVVLRNITVAQKEALEKEAKTKGMTVTGLVKHWVEVLITSKDRGSK